MKPYLAKVMRGYIYPQRTVREPMIVKEAAILSLAFEKPKVQLEKNASILTVNYAFMVKIEELTQYKNHL